MPRDGSRSPDRRHARSRHTRSRSRSHSPQRRRRTPVQQDRYARRKQHSRSRSESQSPERYGSRHHDSHRGGSRSPQRRGGHRSRSRSPEHARRLIDGRRGRGPERERYNDRSDRNRSVERARYDDNGRRSRSPERRARRHSRSASPRRHERRDSPPSHPTARYHAHDDAPSPRRYRDNGRPPSGSQQPPEVGAVLRAVVRDVKPFGVFVQLQGHVQQALVYHTQVSDELELSRNDEDDVRVRALEFMAPRGSDVWVKVVETRRDDRGVLRIGASMKLVDQQNGTDLDPTGSRQAAAAIQGSRGALSAEPPPLNSIHRAVVKDVRPFGVFVQMEGFRRYGLVHASQVANHLEMRPDDSDEEKVAALSSVCEAGDMVWVKVVEIGEDARGPKIACSIKLVSQRDGADLDPHNRMFTPRGAQQQGAAADEDGAGKGPAQVKGGRVDWGHLQAGDKQYGNKKYDLVDDPESDDEMAGGAGVRGAPAAAGGLPPLRSAPMAAAGRGRGAVMPAWMTQEQGGAAGTSMVPSTGAAEAAAGGGQQINNIEDALRVLMASKQHKLKHKKSKHKHKDRSGEKKHKKHKKHKDKDKTKSQKKDKRSKRSSERAEETSTSSEDS